eukprot:TRINITY_DN99171_c0_g1_i1.p1 TRINITY_DN99171_c0_g1~~TRINITY_DN99171_c0_g1_i1.p1  ORF type:complete len:282 (+),score=29.00 TRINITY_DN99171_c0_g1_i1:49-846(+)
MEDLGDQKMISLSSFMKKTWKGEQQYAYSCTAHKVLVLVNELFYRLKLHGYSHCDLSSNNIMINSQAVEDMHPNVVKSLVERRDLGNDIMVIDTISLGNDKIGENDHSDNPCKRTAPIFSAVVQGVAQPALDDQFHLCWIAYTLHKGGGVNPEHLRTFADPGVSCCAALVSKVQWVTTVLHENESAQNASRHMADYLFDRRFFPDIYPKLNETSWKHPQSCTTDAQMQFSLKLRKTLLDALELFDGPTGGGLEKWMNDTVTMQHE